MSYCTISYKNEKPCEKKRERKNRGKGETAESEKKCIRLPEVAKEINLNKEGQANG